MQVIQPAAPLASPSTVLGQVERDTSDWRVRLAMILGANLEGGNAGSSGWGVGDQGHSYGPFQINLPYHPTMTSTTATNPADAVAYMLGSYQRAVNQVAPTLWQSNPEQAAEQAARIAENPAQDYFVARGQSTVDTAYQTAVRELSSGQVVPQSGYGNATPPGYGSTPNGASTIFGIPGTPSTSSIANDVMSAILQGIDVIVHPLVAFLQDAFLVVAGLVIIVVAIVLLAHDAENGAEGGSGQGSAREHEKDDAETAAVVE